MSDTASNPPPDPSKWRHYRSPHRMRSHREAHAPGQDESPPPILEHPLVPANEPQLLATRNELDQLIRDLRAAGQFGYDSEFIGEHSYYPKLCVIQVATCQRVVLIDPLSSDVDLRRFWELLADASIEKVVHAGQQDLEPVVRLMNRAPQNIFDTQIAAAFAGFHYPSALGKLVKQLTGAVMGRALKFSQWDHRPLSAVQLQYAANDVRYLPLLRRLLGERLDALGNMKWAIEECASLSDPTLYQSSPASQRVRVRGVSTLRPRQLAVLHALTAWREGVAREFDLPPRTFLRDDVVFELARCPVSNVRDLDAVRGLPRHVESTYGEAIVGLTAAALRGPYPPKARGYDPEFDRDEHKPCIERIWREVQEACGARSIDPAIAASKSEIAQLVYDSVRGKPVQSTRLSSGWRHELLGAIVAPLMHRG
jgi:ribonuclease D